MINKYKYKYKYISVKSIYLKYNVLLSISKAFLLQEIFNYLQ